MVSKVLRWSIIEDRTQILNQAVDESPKIREKAMAKIDLSDDATLDFIYDSFVDAEYKDSLSKASALFFLRNVDSFASGYGKDFLTPDLQLDNSFRNDKIISLVLFDQRILGAMKESHVKLAKMGDDKSEMPKIRTSKHQSLLAQNIAKPVMV